MPSRAHVQGLRRGCECIGRRPERIALAIAADAGFGRITLLQGVKAASEHEPSDIAAAIFVSGCGRCVREEGERCQRRNRAGTLKQGTIRHTILLVGDGLRTRDDVGRSQRRHKCYEWVSTSAVQSSDLLFACRQQSRRGGYPAQNSF